LLPIADVDPGKERDHDAHYREKHDLFKLWGHNNLPS
jgi:hypothetical protein